MPFSGYITQSSGFKHKLFPCQQLKASPWVNIQNGGSINRHLATVTLAHGWMGEPQRCPKLFLKIPLLLKRVTLIASDEKGRENSH